MCGVTRHILYRDIAATLHSLHDYHPTMNRSPARDSENELRNKEKISVAAASKYLSNLVYSYKGMGLGMVRFFVLVYDCRMREGIRGP